MASTRPIKWTNAVTLVSVAILVGTEFVGTAWAAGWAIGRLLLLDPLVSRVIEVIFALVGLACLVAFMRTAVKFEPIRE